MLLLVAALLAQVVPVQTQFEDAAKALASGDLQRAEAGFKTVLKAQPANVGALANLGTVYSRMDRPADAIQTYKRALKLSPAEPRLLMNLGLAHLKLDEHEAAKPLFAAALKKSPKSAQIRELLATTQVYTGEAREALKGLSELPDTSGVLYLRMLAQLRLGLKEQAESTSAALFAALRPAEAHFLAGRAYYESTLFDEAVKSLELAAGADPKLPGVQRELGKAYVSVRNSGEAKSRLLKALEQNEHDQEAAYFLGAMLIQEDAVSEGIAHLRRAAEKRPNFWGIHYYLGRAFLSQGDPGSAVKHLERAAALNGGEAAVYYQLARALRSAGREAESRNAAARVRELQAKGKPAEALVLK